MRRIRIILSIIALCLVQGVSAQFAIEDIFDTDKMFNHLDVGVTVSSTGLGAEVATPVGEYLRLRTGFTVMPRFKMTSNFPVEVNSGAISEDKRRRMQDVMKNFTGYEMQDNVDMNMHPTWSNFKFLVDIMPIPENNHWSLTVGFYAGGSRIGKAINDEDGTPTLAAVNAYNTFYLKACQGESMFKYEDSWGNIHTVDFPPNFSEKLIESRMMGMPLGYFSDGDRAMMVPEWNFTAKAEMKVRKVRPYVGLGYNTAISRDGMWKLSADAGVLFWGGHPHVYVNNVYKLNADSYFDMGEWKANAETWEWEDDTPQRIDITRDVSDVQGKVGDMVDIVKKFKVYPSFGITISRTIF